MGFSSILTDILLKDAIVCQLVCLFSASGYLRVPSLF